MKQISFDFFLHKLKIQIAKLQQPMQQLISFIIYRYVKNVSIYYFNFFIYKVIHYVDSQGESFSICNLL